MPTMRASVGSRRLKDTRCLLHMITDMRNKLFTSPCYWSLLALRLALFPLIFWIRLLSHHCQLKQAPPQSYSK